VCHTLIHVCGRGLFPRRLAECMLRLDLCFGWLNGIVESVFLLCVRRRGGLGDVFVNWAGDQTDRQTDSWGVVWREMVGKVMVADMPME